jgi:hypothetical protein
VAGKQRLPRMGHGSAYSARRSDMTKPPQTPQGLLPMIHYPRLRNFTAVDDFGSLANFIANRRDRSSFVSRFAAERRPGSSSK